MTTTCKKRGPYLPVGDTEWECTTHDVELVRIAGVWGTPARRDEMVCPVGEPWKASRAMTPETPEQELTRLRLIAEWYSREPCQYVEDGTCAEAGAVLPDEYCGPCLARAAQMEH